MSDEPEEFDEIEESAPEEEEPSESLHDDEEWAAEDEVSRIAEPTEIESAAPLQIPMTISVELGQVETTAEKLLAIEAGNLIELQRSLEQGVDLVVNGRRIGRGELMRVGDQIGVRVTEIG